MTVYSLAALRRERSPEAFPVFVRPPNLPRTCTDLALCEAVKLSLLGAPDEAVAQMLGVQPKALKFWTQSAEWLELVGMLKPEITAQVAQQVTRMTSIAALALEERLLHGDPVYAYKRGKKPEVIGYKAISSSALASMLGTLLEHGARLDKVLRGDNDNEKPDDDEITQLMGLMKSYAQKKGVGGEKARPDSAIDGTAVSEPAE